jgi:hypothetical protein
MIRLQTYAAFSLLTTMSAVYYAFSSREQFYPAMFYLSNSKICFMLLLNTGLVAMCAAWQLVKRIFLGTLREAEVERLNEQSWREVVEILFTVTIFGQDFPVAFFAMVASLLLVKALHWCLRLLIAYEKTCDFYNNIELHRMDMALARNWQQLPPPAAEQQQLPPPPTKQQRLPAHATSSGCSHLCLQRWIYVSLRQQTR